jgi:hypothetical protein
MFGTRAHIHQAGRPPIAPAGRGAGMSQPLDPQAPRGRVHRTRRYRNRRPSPPSPGPSSPSPSRRPATRPHSSRALPTDFVQRAIRSTIRLSSTASNCTLGVSLWLTRSGARNRPAAEPGGEAMGVRGAVAGVLTRAAAAKQGECPATTPHGRRGCIRGWRRSVPRRWDRSTARWGRR